MLGFLKTGFQKVKRALSKTRSQLVGRLRHLFSEPWSESTFDQLEQILYEADLGSACSQDFVRHTRSFLYEHPKASFEEIRQALCAHAVHMLQTPLKVNPIEKKTDEPLIILIVGVNGTGKTTSLAKLASYFQAEKKKVLIAAADTFRAAAIDQLETWASRIGVDIVTSSPGSDPAAVVFDALSAARARHSDVVLIDTAGRLQNKTDLMHELEKIKRVCTKVIPSAPHETLLVLDATSGQNALDQAKTFHAFTPLTGIILAKLDGSAKGGIVLPIYQQIGIPVRWVGVGESSEDLMPFDPENYAKSLFDIGEEG